MSSDFTSQIAHELTGLAPDAQQRVLEYVRSLKTTSKGTIDITEQIQEEEKRLKKEEALHRYSGSVTDLVYSADLTSEPIVATEVMGSYKSLVGFTVEELAAKGGWMGIAHLDDRQVMMACLEELKNGRPTTMEYRITNADGEIRWIHDHSFPFLKDGVLVSVEGYSRDVTEQRMLAEQLVESQKTEVVAQLAASVAHDFNNLLFVIVASVDLIPDSIVKHPNMSETLFNIKEACDRATEVTRSLLAFSRKDKPEVKTVRLSQVLTESSGIVRRSVGERVALRLDFETELDDRVDIDVGHLQLVLLNLAANARAAMPEGGELVIRTRKAAATDDLPELNSQEVVVLELSDNGCGIQPHVIQNVFKPFFTTKSAEEGTGLGLTTCRQIVEHAGGTIRIHSDVGEGTVFSIYLPTTTLPVSAAAISSSNLAIGGNERILLVEDDEAVRRLTAKTLEKLGYRVVSVDSIATARNKFDDNIEALIADVRLPDGDGPTLASDLRRLRPQLPVLLVSGYVDGKARARIDAEGYSVLPKPYSTRQLARSVRVAIESSVIY